MFGSILNKEKANDIDALIVYNESDIKLALKVRSELRSDFLEKGLVLDMLLLSHEEYNECRETINWEMKKLSLTIDKK